MKTALPMAAAATLFVAPAFAQNNTSDHHHRRLHRLADGPLNVDSLGQQRGYEYWRDEVNAKAASKVGDKQYKVNFVAMTTSRSAARVQQLYTRLINQDHAQFLFSPYSSGLTAPAAVISEQYGKIMIDSGGAEEKPFELGNKYLFMVITSASHYLSGAVEALKAKDPNAKIAMVYSDDPFSKAVLTAAKQQALAAGLQVVMDESYSPSTTDFGPIVNKNHLVERRRLHGRRSLLRRRDAGPPDARPESRDEVDLDPGGAGRRQVRRARPSALGVSVPSQWEQQVNYKPQFGPTTAEFAKAFQDKFHAKADYHAASGYTSGVALQHAIEQAGSIDPEKVTAALNATDITTFFGHVKFMTDSGHHGLQDAHKMVLAPVAEHRRQARPPGGVAAGGEVGRTALSDLGQPVIAIASGTGPAHLAPASTP